MMEGNDTKGFPPELMKLGFLQAAREHLDRLLAAHY
jgi:hypothetical protein